MLSLERRDSLTTYMRQEASGHMERQLSPGDLVRTPFKTSLGIVISVKVHQVLVVWGRP